MVPTCKNEEQWRKIITCKTENRGSCMDMASASPITMQKHMANLYREARQIEQ